MTRGPTEIAVLGQRSDLAPPSSFVVFLMRQIAFLPLAVVGVLMVAYKQMVASKRLGSRCG